MAGIRVNTGNLKIEVNDNGDTIILRKDMGFINKVVSFSDGLSALQKEFNEKAKLINKDDINAMQALLYDTHKQLHDALDMIFGTDTCMKVFGDGEVDVIPTLDQVTDFCEQLIPYIQQIAKSLGDGYKQKTSDVYNEHAKPVGYMGKAPETSNATAFAALREQM